MFQSGSVHRTEIFMCFLLFILGSQYLLCELRYAARNSCLRDQEAREKMK